MFVADASRVARRLAARMIRMMMERAGRGRTRARLNAPGGEAFQPAKSGQRKTAPPPARGRGAVLMMFGHSGGGGTRTPKGLRPPHFECGALPVRLRLQILHTVGTAGFEPATPRSRSECSTGLSHVPKLPHGADRVGFEPTRAVNPTRFPIVLLKPLGHRSKTERRGRDSNPRVPFGHDGLANRWF